jgi:hypothetical protein
MERSAALGRGQLATLNGAPDRSLMHTQQPRRFLSGYCRFRFCGAPAVAGSGAPLRLVSGMRGRLVSHNAGKDGSASG